MSETQSRLPGIFDPPGVSDARYARQSQVTPGAQRVPGRISLRDYGAFQADISTLATHRIVAIKDMLPITPAPVAYPKGRFAGVIKIIPFQTKEMRAQGSATEELRLEPGERANGQRASRKKAVSFGLRCAITLLMFGLLGKSISWPTLLAGLFHMRLGMVSLSLVVGAGGIVLSAYQWRSLLSGEGIHLDLANLINLYIVGIAFSHFLPTGMGGDAVKA
ncbi:MAG TPA: lysylphosphatidylglycerol synthase domain-containing protein, partial [Chthonomonadales bacterium]|nr:lysylphosphatidylglycerol synthase domain-containing protein [Chthonomonadales bacterium]